MFDESFFRGAAVGLASALHCSAMCGGIACGANLLLGAKTSGDRNLNLVLMQAGRIVTYAAIGGAAGTFGGEVALIDSADDGSGRFRILVTPDKDEPWPTGMYLRQGVRVNGWVLLDQVKLGYELWRRFNGFPPAVKTPESEAAAKKKKK